ncbi:MAG: sensor histidine kinase [Phocaeicola massiliensis]|jgi:sensor histidine kinase regulating citrate/malate metabolism
MVFGSKLDLALIIDNFLDNSEAWKAKNIWFSCYLQNDNMILNIYDDGEGLSQEFSNNPNEIFQFRKTGKNNGTGFGLYLVQESLRKMNATIIVDSPVNKTGMNFKIIFK